MLKQGDRVQLHAATDSWMQGDRYGTVTGFGRSRPYTGGIATHAGSWRDEKMARHYANIGIGSIVLSDDGDLATIARITVYKNGIPIGVYGDARKQPISE